MAPSGCLAGISAMCCGGGGAQPPPPQRLPSGEELRELVREVVRGEVGAAMRGIEASVGQEMQGVTERLTKGGALEAPPRALRSSARHNTAPGRDVVSSMRRFSEMHMSSSTSAPAERKQVVRYNTTPARPQAMTATIGDDDEEDDPAHIRCHPELDLPVRDRSSSLAARYEALDLTQARFRSEDTHTDGDRATSASHSVAESCASVDDDDAESGDLSPDSKVGTMLEIPRHHRKRSSSWRMTSMDVGEKKAMTSRKDGFSIIGIVSSERERWMMEKETLELRLTDLKARQEELHRPRVDQEKEDLKKRLAELRQSIAQRSRFGAWVCERHMRDQEIDEDGASDGELSEKERLRVQLGELQAKLKDARVQAGGPSESPRYLRKDSCASAASVLHFKAGSFDPDEDDSD